MKKLLLVSLVALFAAAIGRAAPTRDQLIARIESCEAILQEFTSRAHGGAIPAEVWQRAKAVLITNQFKAGIIIGVQDGYGVLMAKHPTTGRWSVPVLVNASEASLGFQLGAKSVMSVFVITDETVPRMLFKNRMNIGVDAKAVAGPKAAEAEKNNEELLKTPILAYTKAEGLFAGATLKAGHVSRADENNFLLYGTRDTMPELLYGDWTNAPKETVFIRELMQKLSP
ncbi:MAG TPA: lipid-binding SYLF domain-containing protein [Opitutaceae bacterium]